MKKHKEFGHSRLSKYSFETTTTSNVEVREDVNVFIIALEGAKFVDEGTVDLFHDLLLYLYRRTVLLSYLSRHSLLHVQLL